MPRFAKSFGFFRLSEIAGDTINLPHDALSSLVDPTLEMPSWPTLVHGSRSCGYVASEMDLRDYGEDVGTIHVYLKPGLFDSHYSSLEQLSEKEHEGANFQYLTAPARERIRDLWIKVLSRAGFAEENFPWDGTRHPELIPKLLKADPHLSRLKAVVYPVRFRMSKGERDLSIVMVVNASVIDGAKADWFYDHKIAMDDFWEGREPQD